MANFTEKITRLALGCVFVLLAGGAFPGLRAEAAPSQELVQDVSDGTFSKEVVESTKPVLVDFWATWCGPCRMFGPIVDRVAEDYKGRLKVRKVNVDQNPGLSQTFQIRAIPTAILFKNGKVVRMWVGLVSGDDLKVEINKVLPKPKKIKSKALKT